MIGNNVAVYEVYSFFLTHFSSVVVELRRNVFIPLVTLTPNTVLEFQRLATSWIYWWTKQKRFLFSWPHFYPTPF